MIRTVAVSILIFLGLFTTTAFASATVPTDGSITDYLQIAFNAVAHGQYWAAGSLAVVMLCAAAKKYLPEKYQTGTLGDIVGTGLAFLMGAAVTLATSAFAPGFVFSVGLLGTAAKIGLVAIGGYNVLHKVLGWLADWKAMPTWLQPILKLASSIIGSDAIEKAQKAGDEAVAAKPAQGLAEGSQVKEIE